MSLHCGRRAIRRNNRATQYVVANSFRFYDRRELNVIAVNSRLSNSVRWVNYRGLECAFISKRQRGEQNVFEPTTPRRREKAQKRNFVNVIRLH